MTAQPFHFPASPTHQVGDAERDYCPDFTPDPGFSGQLLDGVDPIPAADLTDGANGIWADDWLAPTALPPGLDVFLF
ncbi:hypothetical protein PE067_14940 [Paracoccus sp. DMF-8]|uniref:hypothetical protein n=1 Tax=Paracoccus sp. DMF-8 TaxID=3019445 RepID=UPI0023E44996|nr:hypothetical protein [Paracoccus sp. DMF-8]MDF3607314.1 hypothetical protein [Paracoccus sp. DMF-8]